MRASVEVAAAAGLALLLFLPGMADVPLTGRDEARFAQASREMLARGELVVPTFAGADRYHKPILFYWCCAASFSVFGVEVWAARLPSMVAGVLVVALLAFSARRRWGEGAGVLAGALVAATVCFNLQARACTADMVMILPTVAAMLALERLWTGQGGWRSALVFWLGMAAAMLAKGPVAPVVAAATAVALWALNRHWRRWELGLSAVAMAAGWLALGVMVLALPVAVALIETSRSAAGRRALGSLRWWWGLPLCGAVVLPWAVAAQLATDGAFLSEAFGRHVVARSLSPFDSHSGFPGFYLVTALVAALPWSAIGLPAAAEAARVRRRDDRSRFLLAWLIGPMVVLELVATKLVHYWMPAYPAGVLLVVGWLMSRRGHSSALPISARVAAAVGALVVAGLPLAAVIRFRLDDLLGWAVVTALPLLLWVVVTCFPPARPAGRAAVLLVAATAGTMILLTAVLGPRLAEHTLAVRAVRWVDDHVEAGETVVVYRVRDDELFFSLPLRTVSCGSQERLEQLLAAAARTLVVTRSDSLDALLESPLGSSLEVIDRVEGLDLGRGRRAQLTMIRSMGAR